ncbi:alpha-2-HS-glycoprotein 2 [Cyclopterus lumpus]|uniref:alpha-2-HS-glycoprotein 2 n=1 Tax=Cyclopterus lumpus TaxID=8103 RepID=UPI0014865306|nr:alpha-2-HS-glycoprotein 2 [Cyclopterus lumpus]
MHFLGITLILGLLAGVWTQINVVRPQCDSPEAEEAALVAQDFLNAQHTHVYKYALNQIEDIKIYTKPDGDNTYVLEVELLETDCHVLDPTPLANCTVRPKILTAIEGECDVVLKKVGGALTVTAFKCKTDESTEDLCLGCATLLPLNDTRALNFVYASLATLNNITLDTEYAIMEIGRMSSQVLSGGPIYFAEYVVVDATAARGICTAKGLSTDHTVDCKMFSTLMPVVDANSTVIDANSTVIDANSTVIDANSTVIDANSTVADANSGIADANSTVIDAKSAVADANSTVADANSTIADANITAAPAMPSVVHVHTGSPSPKHGLRHHKLTALHDPELSGFLSAESAESAEVVPEAPAVVGVAAPAATLAAADPAAAAGAVSDSSASAEVTLVVMKKDVPVTPATSVVETRTTQTDPIALVPVCPGRVRFF